tara:strand:+ start:1635 stop:2567 length:933 start_codon:yes stop_codon:yes gene_type:complete
MKKLYFIATRIYKYSLVPVSLLSKLLNFFGHIFKKLSSYFVLFYKGNYFFMNFKTDTKILKNLNYKNLKMRVKINTYWDYWRIRNFESLPVDEIINDKNDQKSKKIIFYEIGANIGYSSILVSKILEEEEKVYCFEIEPANFKTLSDNILLNRLSNIIPFNIGISSENGVKKLYYNTLFNKDNDYLPQSAMGSHSITFDKKIHKEKIFCYTYLMDFETVVTTFNLEKPTHIFIDAYGAEIGIIQSILSSKHTSNIEKIIVDIEEKEKLENTKVYKLLIEFGFKLTFNETEYTQDTENKFIAYHTIFTRKI